MVNWKEKFKTLATLITEALGMKINNTNDLTQRIIDSVDTVMPDVLSQVWLKL
jgi:hypothetical protein